MSSWRHQMGGLGALWSPCRRDNDLGGAKPPKFGGFYGVGAAEKKGRANVSVAHHPFYTL